MQELILAEAVEFWCGTASIKFEVLLEFALAAKECESSLLSQYRKTSGISAIPYFHAFYESLIQRRDHRGTRQSDQPEAQRSLPDLVCLHREKRCSDPRDRVYALLSLVRQRVSPGMEHLAANYQLSRLELFFGLLTHAHKKRVIDYNMVYDLIKALEVDWPKWPRDAVAPASNFLASPNDSVNPWHRVWSSPRRYTLQLSGRASVTWVMKPRPTSEGLVGPATHLLWYPFLGRYHDSHGARWIYGLSARKIKFGSLIYEFNRVSYDGMTVCIPDGEGILPDDANMKERPLRFARSAVCEIDNSYHKDRISFQELFDRPDVPMLVSLSAPGYDFMFADDQQAPARMIRVSKWPSEGRDDVAREQSPANELEVSVDARLMASLINMGLKKSSPKAFGDWPQDVSNYQTSRYRERHKRE